MSESKAKMAELLNHFGRVVREASDLVNMVDDAGGEIEDCWFAPLRAALKGIQLPEIKQDALDAARYRWLESKHNSGDENWFVYGASSDNMTVSIDAAISAEKKEGA